MAYTEWNKVWALVQKVVKELKAKKPTLTQAEATKQAWKHPDVLKARKEYDAHKAASTTKSSTKKAVKKKK